MIRRLENPRSWCCQNSVPGEGSFLAYRRPISVTFHGLSSLCVWGQTVCTHTRASERDWFIFWWFSDLMLIAYFCLILTRKSFRILNWRYFLLERIIIILVWAKEAKDLRPILSSSRVLGWCHVASVQLFHQQLRQVSHRKGRGRGCGKAEH